MVNGNMEFENIPINTIVNEFIKKTNMEKLKSIEDIKNEFLDFIKRYTQTSSSENYLKYILENFKEDFIEEIKEKGFDKTLDTKKRNRIHPFIKRYSNFNEEFNDIIPQNRHSEKYTKILWEIFSHDLKYEGTGIIIAGYGIDIPYPSFFEINLHCNDENGIFYEEIESKIDFEDTIIRIYAMNKEGYAFFTGVNEEFIDFLNLFVDETNEGILQKLKWKLKKEKIEPVDEIISLAEEVLYEKYSILNEQITYFESIAIEDTSKSIEFIPSNLLCILAGEIIRLTALKQKISSEEEYVSMNNHISLITKSNGFKWIKSSDEII